MEIRRVFSLNSTYEQDKERFKRWSKDFQLAKQMFDNVGIELFLFGDDINT